MCNGTNKNKKQGQPVGDGTANPVGGSKVPLKLKSLTINVFFDGTGNNMHNTTSGLKGGKKGDSVSYTNYYSNVALLYMACQETGTSKKIYIDGSGTTRGQADDTAGLGFSVLASGLKSRAAEAFIECEKKVKEAPAEQIVFNVFGFSRGAFSARYFCYMLKSKKEFEKKGVVTSTKTGGRRPTIRDRFSKSPSEVSINLVGIFDTVSSHGLDHYNDVKAFNLNISKTRDGIQKIVHLTAQNDYRYHFPLTRINTAVADKCGFECSFPGAHSDLGGGYPKEWKETEKELSFYSNYTATIKNPNPKQPPLDGSLVGKNFISWRWWVSKGYYTGNPDPDKNLISGDLFIKKHHIGKASGSLASYAPFVYAKRTTTYHYQFILADVMKSVAADYAKISFSGDKSKILVDGILSMKAIPLLSKFHQGAYGYVMKNYKTNGLDYRVPTLSGDEMKQIYKKYLHNSLDNVVANVGAEINKKLVNGKRDFLSPTRITING